MSTVFSLILHTVKKNSVQFTVKKRQLWLPETKLSVGFLPLLLNTLTLLQVLSA